ncbi:MAG: 2-C-methyl-D-erythritol 4-phosphate cytidylyltransferase [Phycisphaerales bacterium]|nr:2-C-methyl-D-erythritol 4-phosphate cytidylyltransferase [Phycisphaerales bacterium]
MSETIWVVIPAAGQSQRFGPTNKLDQDLGGRPVLHRSVELFASRDDVAGIVVAGPHDDEAFGAFRERHGPKLGMLGCRLCQGGQNTRAESVLAALAHVPDDAGFIAVHDAARPCTSERLIDRLFETATRAGAGAAIVPGLDVTETIKRVASERVDATPPDPIDAILGGAGREKYAGRAVQGTLDRTGLVAVQTPQVFGAILLRKAYAQTPLDATDDAQLVERTGATVLVVEGDSHNIKITTPHDLDLARRILNVKAPTLRAAHKRF